MIIINKGQDNQADALFQLLPNHPLALIWRGYLNEDKSLIVQASGLSSDFVFPFRRESLQALEWANDQQQHWILKYYWALNLWHKGQPKKAKSLMDASSNQPTTLAFYQSRAALQEDKHLKGKDLQRRYLLNPGDWRGIQSFV